MGEIELLALAERVEGLSGPDTTADVLILLATGWTLERAPALGERATWINPQGEHTSRRQGDGWFKPTESLDAAMSLVPKGSPWKVQDHPDWSVSAVVDVEEGYATTPAIALCAAALRARASITRTTGDGDGNNG